MEVRGIRINGRNPGLWLWFFRLLMQLIHVASEVESLNTRYV